MTRDLICSVVLACGLSVTAAFAQGQTEASRLEGRIWDFTATHPDFERKAGGLSKGRVASDLGADGRMVWIGQSNAMFSSEQNFNQWYRDVAAVNASMAFEIKLEEVAGTGRYEYNSTAFFPIDNQLMGNEGDIYTDDAGTPHNFHFTTHLAGEFTFSGPEDQFSFTGDDDLWVFFDGKLGIDLGGIHSPEKASIDGAQLIALGLQPSLSYKLDIFHAERHTTGSNFRIETNFDITAPRNSELPSGIGVPVNAASKIDTLIYAGICADTNFDLAQLLATQAPEAKFLSVYCAELSNGSTGHVGIANTVQEAELTALSACLNAVSVPEGPEIIAACAPYGLAERISVPIAGAVVNPGEALLPGKEYPAASNDYVLVSGNGGDLAVRNGKTGEATWIFRLLSINASKVVMLESGTMAMLDKNGVVVWQTPIAEPVPGSYFDIAQDGTAIINTPDGTVVWRSDMLSEPSAETLSYLNWMRSASSETFLSGDGGDTTVTTTTYTTREVIHTLPMNQARIVSDASEIVIAGNAPLNPVEPGVGDNAPGAVPSLPEFGTLLTYSVNDQVRKTENSANDYFVAFDGGAGVILQGSGQVFEIVKLGNGDQILFKLASGQYAGSFLTAIDDQVTPKDQIEDAAKFIVRAPLEPTAGIFASFESVAFPGMYLRHQGLRLRLDKATPESASLLRRDATFRIEVAQPDAIQAAVAAQVSCHDTVQNRIAYDYEGSSTWGENNIAALCGTVASTEPAACFQRVMHGGTEWAAGEVVWSWQDALKLCAGTTDATARVDCFEATMPTSGWEAAIGVCRLQTPGENKQ